MSKRLPKRSMRVLAALLLLPALAMLVAACSGDDDDASPTTAANASSPSTAATKAAGSPTAATSGSAADKLKAVELPLEMASGSDLGAPGAKVVLTVYEDFQCPHCLSYTANIEPMIINDYVKTGKVRIEFRNLPILGQESVLAAIAGYCAADQGKFWEMHNQLFLVQAEAGQLTDEKTNVGRFSIDNLIKYASDVGLDTAAFSTCASADTTVAALTQQLQDAQDLGFRGTPSFAVNGVAQSGQPATLDAWKKFLDEQLKKN